MTRQSYKTVGTCSKWIHYEIENGVLQHVEFVGGCPGNALAVCKLIVGRSVAEVITLLEGIPCRNDTSCPDQLAQALKPEHERVLPRVPELSTRRVPGVLKRAAILSDVHANLTALRVALEDAQQRQPDAILCLGDLVGMGREPNETVELARAAGVVAIQGDFDRCAVLGPEACAGQFASSAPGERDVVLDSLEWTARTLAAENRQFLAELPSVLEWRQGELKAMAFHGSPVETLAGFRDDVRFGPEILGIVNLSRYLRNEAVAPVMEQLVADFECDIHLFGHTHQPLSRTIQGKHFVNVGAIGSGGGLAEYTLVEAEGDNVKFSRITVAYDAKGG